MIDDHPLYRSGFIRHLLEFRPFKVYQFESLFAAQLALSDALPDIIFLDLELPDGSGLTVIQDYLKIEPCPKVAILTTHQQLNYIQRAEQLGAHAYLLKDDHPDVVYQCLDHFEKGTDFFLSERSRALLKSQSNELPEDKLDISNLTAREKEILFYLGMDLTSKEIAKNMGLSFRTVQNHRANIKSRLMLSRNSQLIRLANASHGALNKLFSKS